MRPLQELMKVRLKGNNLLWLLLLFYPIAVARFLQMVSHAWSSYLGEFFATFPFYFLLERYNPLLYQSVTAVKAGWFPHSWYYGPLHHLWLFPVTFFVHSVDVFLRFLFIFYILLIIIVPLLLCNTINRNRSFLFLAGFFTIILGSFSVLENLKQRNVELLEFSLIIMAYLCLRKNRDYAGGSLLCFAAMAKLLPFIFLPYLFVKKRFKALIAFFITFIVIFITTQVTLGWQNWAVLDRETMETSKLALSVDQFLGKAYFTPISQARGSFYSFILSFFSKVDMSSYVPVVIYKNFLIPNLLYIFLSFLFLAYSFFLFYRNGKKGDLFHEFSILLLTMLLVSHHTNPHYYIFTLFAFIGILKFYTYDLINYRLTIRTQISIISIFIFTLLSTGNLVPLSIYNKIFPLKNSAFHYFTTYGIFGLSTLILWFLMLWIYQVDYEKYDVKSLNG